MQRHWPSAGDATAASEKDPGFFTYLRRSLAEWRRHPRLPLVTLAVAGLTSVPAEGGSGIIAFAALLFSIGWPGTQRIWYLRAFRGKPMPPGDVWSLSWRFFGRHFRFFFLIGGLVFGGTFWLVWLANGSRAPEPRYLALYFAPLIIVCDVAGSFIMPALAYSTRSVRTAIREGLGMLRSEWPACLWYAVAPPLALAVVGFGLLEPIVGAVAAAAISLTVGNLLNLWFKGAIALFYLRRNEWVPDDGSARA